MADAPADLHFEIDSWVVFQLGEQLVTDVVQALVELVKNCYDADATEVSVELHHLGTADDTTVIVQDNGCGMTLDDITAKWLSPAVDHKDPEAVRFDIGQVLARVDEQGDLFAPVLTMEQELPSVS